MSAIDDTQARYFQALKGFVWQTKPFRLSLLT